MFLERMDRKSEYLPRKGGCFCSEVKERLLKFSMKHSNSHSIAKVPCLIGVCSDIEILQRQT